MSTKCPFCGEEYSYGRIICHDCGESKIFFGALFDNNKKERKWNCNCDMNVIPKLKKEKKYLPESVNYVIYNDYFSSIQLISIIPQ